MRQAAKNMPQKPPGGGGGGGGGNKDGQGYSTKVVGGVVQRVPITVSSCGWGLLS